MKKEKQQHNFRFHNPNSDEATIEMILSALLAANKKKADEAIEQELEKEETTCGDS